MSKSPFISLLLLLIVFLNSASFSIAQTEHPAETNVIQTGGHSLSQRERARVRENSLKKGQDSVEQPTFSPSPVSSPSRERKTDDRLNVIPASHSKSSELFRDAEATGPRQLSATIQKRRTVSINHEALRLAVSQGGELIFNLFPESTFVGRIESIQTRTESNYTITGTLEGRPFSSFVLVANEDVVVMNVRPGDDGLIQIRFVGNGLHEVQKIDEQQFPPCETGPEHAVEAPPKKDAEDDSHPGVASDAGDFIDVMVVYTLSARTAAGGTAAIEALISLAITESNTAYEQSLITPRLRLAYVGMVNYTESSSFNTDLERLTGTSDGFMDEVHVLRNTHAADMVSLWVNNSSSCGIAYVMTSLSSSFQSFAFSTVHYSCATGYYTFGHELGHNMGCAHNRANASTPGLNSYSYGWHFVGTNGNQYRTIMAYDPGTRVQRFSNPDVSYLGTSTGVPIGDPNEAHNAQTINNSAVTIANFRQASSASGPPVIIAQPASRTVFAGETALFSVTVSGASPRTYQWRHNGSPISGATHSSHTITNVQSFDSGTYSIVVTNAFGMATSSSASLTVNPSTSLALALDNNGFQWLTNGNRPWVGQFAVSYDGTDAAESGGISHSQQSGFQTTIDGPGTLTFRWKVSSESLYDFLRFYLNGTQQSSISGDVNWQLKSFDIPAGTQTAAWLYTKDGSVHSLQDKGWVDRVVFITQPSLMTESAVRSIGQFQFNFSGAKGGSYTIYGSSNLVTWDPLTNFVSTNSTSLFIDTNVGNGTGNFYRVGSP